MEDQEKEAIIRAKQAISPASLGDRSDKATTMPGNDSPDDSPIEDMSSQAGKDPEGDTSLTGNTD